jgi:hypothetical protein
LDVRITTQLSLDIRMTSETTVLQRTYSPKPVKEIYIQTLKNKGILFIAFTLIYDKIVLEHVLKGLRFVLQPLLKFPKPTWVPYQIGSCGICGGQSGTGTDFLRVLRFPLPILIQHSTPHGS